MSSALKTWRAFESKQECFKNLENIYKFHSNQKLIVRANSCVRREENAVDGLFVGAWIN